MWSLFRRVHIWTPGDYTAASFLIRSRRLWSLSTCLTASFPSKINLEAWLPRVFGSCMILRYKEAQGLKSKTEVPQGWTQIAAWLKR